MQKIILILFFCFFNSYFINSNQYLKVDLVDIKYFSICDCSEASPIMVCVKMKTTQKNIDDLKMIIKYPNQILKTTNVKEIDENGNIIYSFCAKKDAKFEFIIYFVDQQGFESNEIDLKIDMSKL